MSRRVEWFALAAVVVLVIAAVPAAASSDWPQYGYDGGHSNYNRLERLLTPLSVEGLRFAWSARVAPKEPHGYEQFSASMVVREGRAFVSWMADESGSRLTALDVSDGTELWHRRYRDTSARSVASTPEDVIANVGNRVVAFDLGTGATAWTRRSARVTAASKTGSILAVAFVGRPREIGAISGADGSVLWRRTLPHASDPLLSRGVLLATARSERGPRILAMDPADGGTLWRRAIGRGDRLQIAAAGRAYLLGRAGQDGVLLKAFRTSDGQRRWVRSLRTRMTVEVQTAGGGHVYLSRLRCVSGCEGDAFGKYRGSLLALDASNGNTAWRLAGGVGTGAPLWVADAGTPGLVYVNGFRGFERVRLAALIAENGHVTWSTSFGERTYGEVVAVADGRVFVGTASGYSAHPNSGGRVYVFALP